MSSQYRTAMQQPRLKHMCSKHFRKQSPALINALAYGIEPHVELDVCDSDTRCEAPHCTSQATMRVLLGPANEQRMRQWVQARRYVDAS